MWKDYDVFRIKNNEFWNKTEDKMQNCIEK